MKYGIEVELTSDFLVIKETLERIGIANCRKKVITPSCYVFHHKNRYYIMHFKELLALYGYKEEIDETDIERRDAIATLLANWRMVVIKDHDEYYQKELKQKIFVLHFKDKKDYKINHKYQIRRRKD